MFKNFWLFNYKKVLLWTAASQLRFTSAYSTLCVIAMTWSCDVVILPPTSEIDPLLMQFNTHIFTKNSGFKQAGLLLSNKKSPSSIQNRNRSPYLLPFRVFFVIMARLKLYVQNKRAVPQYTQYVTIKDFIRVATGTRSTVAEQEGRGEFHTSPLKHRDVAMSHTWRRKQIIYRAKNKEYYDDLIWIGNYFIWAEECCARCSVMTSL